jgi:hypothetical protein
LAGADFDAAIVKNQAFCLNLSKTPGAGATNTNLHKIQNAFASGGSGANQAAVNHCA